MLTFALPQGCSLQSAIFGQGLQPLSAPLLTDRVTKSHEKDGNFSR